MPTFRPSNSQCSMLASTSTQCAAVTPKGSCVWTEVSACSSGKKCTTLEYGCQSYAFCGFNQSPVPASQCASHSNYCFWDTTTNSCQPKCATPALLTQRSLCSSLTIGNSKAVDGIKTAKIFESNSVKDYIGTSLSGLPGDFNGDGHLDIVIGAPQTPPKILDGHGTGAVYVIFGPFKGIPTFDLNNLDGTNGVRLNGTNIADLAGSSVSFVGDANGDGIDDLLIGASEASANGHNQNGLAYLVYGQKTWPASVALSSLTVKTGVVIPGPVDGNLFGGAVASAGDMNRDGLADFMISALDAGPPGRPRAGITFVIFGSKALPAMFDVNTLNGVIGFKVYGANTYDFSGTAVGPAGDVNFDRYDDIVIGAPWANHPVTLESGVGVVYVIFGGPKGFYSSTGIVDLLNDLGPDDTTVAASAFGFRIRGVSYHWGQMGASVSARPGDVNGDHFSDILMGAPHASPGNADSIGEAYVVMGRASFKATIDLATLDGVHGYGMIGERASDNAGTAVAFVGDLNADGWDDMAVGSPYYVNNGNRVAGAVYVVYGQCSQQAPTAGYISLGSLTGTTGIIIYGYSKQQMFGTAIAGPSDINGDGFDDLVLSSPPDGLTTTTLDSGSVYVIYSC